MSWLHEQTGELLAQIEEETPDAWVPGLQGSAREAVRANLAEISRTREAQLPIWMAQSPLVEICLDDFELLDDFEPPLAGYIPPVT